MKIFLMMALAASAMFVSCSKQDDTNANSKGMASLSVNIDMSKFAQTKSGDNAMTGTLPDWDKIMFIVTGKDGSPINIIKSIYTKAEMVTGKVTLIEKITNTNLVGGKVEAYITTLDNAWGMTTANLPILADAQKDINNWQKSGLIKTGVAGEFKNIPYYGSDVVILSATPNADGHNLLTATINIAPELGRVQVVGELEVGGVTTSGISISEIKVDNVYINKITSGNPSAVKDIREGGTSAISDWKGKYYTGTDAIIPGLTDPSTDMGYHIFEGDTPHVIVKVTYKTKVNNVEDPTEKVGYITLTQFTYGTVTAADLTVTKGDIFNVDLSQFQPKFDQITDEPYDDNKYYDLITTVTIKAWTIVAVKPGL